MSISNPSIADMRIAFAGAGAFGVPTLQRLVEAKANVVRVYTQPDRPAGRGKKMTPTPIAEAAAAMGLEVVRTADLNAETLPDIDALVVIAFGQKIASHIVDKPKFGAINLHASLLPKYRGAAPIHAAILAGEPVAGNSIIRLAEKMDAGNVLGTVELAIHPNETTGELHDRLAVAGAPLVEQVLEQLRSGDAIEVQQDHAAATLARKLSRESTRIDFNRPPQSVADQIRGLYPWPGCRVRLLDGADEVARLTLVRARLAPAPGIPGAGLSSSGASGKPGGPDSNPLPAYRERGQEVVPGTVTAEGHVACGDGGIELIEVQPEGRRPMTLAAYRNGRPWTAGLRLESIV
ncbi:MAG TPA: methionyl-tRNA formyltransferase [Tepidisphaeraceae bacterium]